MFCPRAGDDRHGIFARQDGRPTDAGNGGNAMTGGDRRRDAGRRNFGRLSRWCRWRIARWLAEADMLADGAGAEVSSAKLKLPVAIPNATNKQINFIVFIS